MLFTKNSECKTNYLLKDYAWLEYVFCFGSDFKLFHESIYPPDSCSEAKQTSEFLVIFGILDWGHKSL